MDHLLLFTVTAAAVLMLTAIAPRPFRDAGRRRFRAFSGLAAAVLVLALAGCGVTDSNKPPKTPDDITQPSQDTQNTTKPVQNGFEYSFTSEEVSEVGFRIRSYYIVSGPSPNSKDENYIENWKVLAAESFGYEMDDHEVRLQNSRRFGGSDVLVCNCTYGGDGANRTYVYGWTNQGLEKIYIDMDTLDLKDWDNTGTLSYQQNYDAETSQFVVQYRNRDGNTSYKRLDLSSLDDENVFRTDKIMAVAGQYWIFDPENTAKYKIDVARYGKSEPSPAAKDAAEVEKAAETALEQLRKSYILPDGLQLDHDSSRLVSENRYAVCDINGDGKSELIISWVTSPTVAGLYEEVYSYDSATGTFTNILSETPGVDYYDNGYAVAKASHNHTPSQKFWPVSVYKYDADMHKYLCALDISAIDRYLGWEENPAYPADVDKEDAGTVYVVTDRDLKSTLPPVPGPLSAQNAPKQVGETDFIDWFTGWMDELTLLQPDWKPL